MGANQLQEFFREKKARATPADVDWAAKRDAWINAVGNLYDVIEKSYLAGTLDSVTIDRGRMKGVTEPFIGDYSIPEMALTVGNEMVLFSPKAAQVVGAAGRMDVRGDRGEATIVCQPGDRWALIISRTPKLQLVELNEETFLDMLRSVMR